MTSGVAAHLRDLEHDALEAEKDLETFRDKYHHLTETWNIEINELIQKVQRDKAVLREKLEKKELVAKRKNDEVQLFRDTLNGSAPPSLASNGSTYQSSRPSTHSEPTRNSLTSLDESSPITAVNQPEAIESPKPLKVSVNNGIPAMSSLNKYFPDLPVICRTPVGNWVEIRCFICHGNFIDKKGWIRGTRGMLAHVGKSHMINTCDGVRLDSVTILQFCTIRELSDDEAQAIADGVSKVEMIFCRDVNNVDMDSIKPYKPTSSPKVNGMENEKRLIAEFGEDKGHLVSDSGKLSDWMTRYPTIVLTKGGSWVELRCDICAGNSLANGDRRFAQGIIGFVRHLSRGHGIRPNNPNKHLDWALDRCTYHVLTQEELDSLAHETHSPYAPPKIPFKQTDASLEGVAQDAVKPITELQTPADAAKRRPSKRSIEALEITEEEEESEEPEVEAADSDFQPENGKPAGTPNKRARHSLSATTTSVPKLSTRKRGGKVGHSRSVPASPITPKSGEFLDKFCPCSVSGHVCQNETCDKPVLCGQASHDDSCVELSHETRPTCVMSLLGGECSDEDQCHKGHDMLEERKKKAHHDCKNH